MFSSHKQLVKRSGKKGIDRPEFLKELVEEYKNNESIEIQEQIVANLANFSYDPLNFKWLIDLGVVDIFLQGISSNSPNLQRFSITGLCNLSPDKEASKVIVRGGGILLILQLLKSTNEKCILDSLATLIYLVTSQRESVLDVITSSALEDLHRFCSSENQRIRNLATIFMADNFPKESNE